MKFISKSSNYLVVIKPGLPAQPMIGRLAEPTVSVRFQNGVANVEDEELIARMKSHPSFNTDFIAAESEGEDPFAYLRSHSEPEHVHTEMRFGTPQRSNAGVAAQPKVPAAIQTLINEKAAELAKQMLPELVRSTLKEMAVENSSIVAAAEAEQAAKNTLVVPPSINAATTESTDDTTKRQGRQKRQ